MEKDILEEMFDNDHQQKMMECVRSIIETLSYLSLHVKNKKLLASQNNGRNLRSIFKLANTGDKIIRYGINSIVQNCTVSETDLNQDYDKEIEQLRKIASKGLPNNDKREELSKKAGDVKTIKVIRQLLVQEGAVAALFKIYKAYEVEHQQLTEKVKDNPEIANSDEGKIPKHCVSEVVCGALAKSLVHMSTVESSRGKMVQEGALGLAINLFSIGEDKSKTDAATAIARICISTDPHKYNDGVRMSLLTPLRWLMNNSSHELLQFEALLGLTNLASLDDDIKNRIVSDGGWAELMAVLGSDNYRVQRAAVECMANLSVCSKALDRLHTEGGTQDLKIILMFCNTDDVPTQSAATGALAMISDVPLLAEKIATTELTSWVKTEDLEVDEELVGEVKSDESGESVEFTRTGLEVLLNLQLKATLDAGVRTRVNYALNNIQQVLTKKK